MLRNKKMIAGAFIKNIHFIILGIEIDWQCSIG
jgi:hypothetical protein